MDDLNCLKEKIMKQLCWQVGVDVKVNLMKPSVFENPTWVTAKKDIILSEGQELTNKKDYKVENIVEYREDGFKNKLYLITNDLGKQVSYHPSKFDKIAPDDVLQNVFPFEGHEDPAEKEPTPCEEVGTDSFDGLVYVQPERDCHIRINTLTDEQKNFLSPNLTWFDKDRFDKEFLVLCYCVKDRDWFVNTNRVSLSSKISFNDIFVHKSQLEEE
ncbi:hypothetical protein NVP1084O_030 [Vibrio phage 1.084.O._10N.261.49.F5]|nr:hypothetical protein NVP1084O_030 [Vibrio phage 1.084.O._10N.261.49.F5]